jgi:Flp pilus assembly protein TadD
MNLGTALLQKGRYGEAIPHLEKAVAGNPDSLDFQLSLAAAYAGAGRLADAAKTLRSALAIAEKQGDRQLVGTIKSRLAAYETKR